MIGYKLNIDKITAALESIAYLTEAERGMDEETRKKLRIAVVEISQSTRFFTKQLRWLNYVFLQADVWIATTCAARGLRYPENITKAYNSDF